MANRRNFRIFFLKLFILFNDQWQRWFSSWVNEGNRSKREAELLVEIINLTAGYWSKDVQLNPEYQKLLEVTNRICTGLRNHQSNKVSNEY